MAHVAQAPNFPENASEINFNNHKMKGREIERIFYLDFKLQLAIAKLQIANSCPRISYYS